MLKERRTAARPGQNRANALAIEVAGERVLLLPARALFWPSERVLFVADLHVGKAAAFRAAGAPISDAVLRADLDRLGLLLDELQVQKLMILGDLLHARVGRKRWTAALLRAWRQRHGGVEMCLVRGNHDRAAGDPPADWEMAVVSPPFALGPFELRHEPEPAKRPGVCALAGHLHPKARLIGPGGDSLALPCFWMQPNVAVLPAFSGFVDGAVVKPRSGDRVYVVADDQVIPVHADE